MVEKCYARALGDCSGTLTREHSISEVILKAIDQGEGVEVSGLSWMAKGTSQLLPPSALASKVLCKFHNEKLSPYDATAQHAFDALSAAIDAAHSGSAGIPTAHVDATRFACWLLKALCGLAASQQVSSIEGAKAAINVETAWVEVLFGRRPWPPHWSLAGLPCNGTTAVDTFRRRRADYSSSWRRFGRRHRGKTKRRHFRGVPSRATGEA